MKKKNWNVVGLMSGTSLDGLDIALCEFGLENDQSISFRILKAVTFEYSEEEKSRLSLMNASASHLAEMDTWFGRFCGQKVAQFLSENRLSADFVASHGHTVFHQPSKMYTTQIGNGAALSVASDLPVVCDFRTMDVALGGQGAPLVPIGDLVLFKEYPFCLNLGGIANLSIKKGNGIFAFDICPVNIALNFLSKQIGLEYDKNGEVARKGKIDPVLLSKMEKLDFYSLSYPKSLGREWIDSQFIPILQESIVSIEDKLTTVCEHVALRIASEVLSYAAEPGTLFVTGGGAFHLFLIERLQEKLGDRCQVKIPDPELVCFKEALVFAFLGLLRITNQVNCLSQVTGARKDSMGGALYGDFSKLLSNY